MSKKSTATTGLKQPELTIRELTAQGWIPIKPSMPMVHPDGRVAFVSADGTYAVVEHLADALRSVGRPAKGLAEFDATHKRAD